jgi:hypothetical protein
MPIRVSNSDTRKTLQGPASREDCQIGRRSEYYYSEWASCEMTSKIGSYFTLALSTLSFGTVA